MNIRYNTEKHTSSLLFCFFFFFFSHTVWAWVPIALLCRVRGQDSSVVSRVSFSFPPFYPRGQNQVVRLWGKEGPLPSARTQVARLALKSLHSGCQWPWTLNHLAATSQGLGQYLWATTLGIDPFNLKYSRNGLGVQVKKKSFCIRTPKVCMYTTIQNPTLSQCT